eukprot:6562607-Prymnesium_polylepis.2
MQRGIGTLGLTVTRADTAEASTARALKLLRRALCALMMGLSRAVHLRLVICRLDALAAASSSSSSSIAIDSAANIASDTNKASQVIGTGEFYFNTTNQLRVQYKTGASSFHDFFLATLDTTSPVVTLTGSASVTHQLGATYTDAGATATDNALMAVHTLDHHVHGHGRRWELGNADAHCLGPFDKPHIKPY